MSKPSGELEFVSVDAEDGSQMDNTYANDVSGDYDISVWDRVNIFSSFTKQSKLTRWILKALAIFLYIFGGWFSFNYITIFVLCIILLAFDFWTVKNITGRLLVGLRWWSYTREDGSNEWIFESLEDMAEISNFDSKVFWGALYGAPLAWGVLLILGIFRLKIEYLPVVISALSLSGANVMGYLKCSSSAKEKMNNMVQQGLRKGSMVALENSSVFNWVFSALVPSSTSEPSDEAKGLNSRSVEV